MVSNRVQHNNLLLSLLVSSIFVKVTII